MGVCMCVCVSVCGDVFGGLENKNIKLAHDSCYVAISIALELTLSKHLNVHLL